MQTKQTQPTEGRERVPQNLIFYDPIGQLTNAQSSASGQSRGYAYDAAWNLETVSGGGKSFSVNDRNELTSGSESGVTFDFAYDENGNLTDTTNNPGATAITTVYTYDDENRLTAVQISKGATGNKVTFIYDGLGRMREQLKWTTSNITNGVWSQISGIFYIYDGTRVIQERTTNNVPAVSYTRGNDVSGTLAGAGGIGGLLARSDGYSSGNFSDHDYYHADGNGNITYLETTNQTLAASYQYDAFGNVLSSSGSLASANTYQFSSKEYIGTISTFTVGLYAYLYRFYSPSLQRWLNRDPIGEPGFEKDHDQRRHKKGAHSLVQAEPTERPNLFQFVANDPICRVDPDGLLFMPPRHPNNGPWNCYDTGAVLALAGLAIAVPLGASAIAGLLAGDGVLIIEITIDDPPPPGRGPLGPPLPDPGRGPLGPPPPGGPLGPWSNN